MSWVAGLDDGIGFGVLGWTDTGDGVRGQSESGPGVRGLSKSGPGVRGRSDSSVGVYGQSNSYRGVSGRSNSGVGVYGLCIDGNGVSGRSNSGAGVHGMSLEGHGVSGISHIGVGVSGVSGQIGVFGWGYTGVFGNSYYGPGVHGGSDSGNGVVGRSNSRNGVRGTSNSGNGVYGRSNSGLAALLEGNVTITGTLQKGGGRFKIDHPLDPANKYLSHSFVESPDMKNVYDGVVELDDKGEAEIELPDWFSALNKDFRYQLTAIGAPGPNLYIAKEISDATSNYSNSNSNSNNNNNSRFKIAGGTSGMKVSWQVTGIRQDPWANVNRIQVEEGKPDKERGYYIYPDLYEQPPEKGISHLLFPEEEKWQDQLIR